MGFNKITFLILAAFFLSTATAAAVAGHHRPVVRRPGVGGVRRPVPVGGARIVPAVSPFCKSASDSVLCNAMAKGANTWQQAMTNMITSTMERVKARQAIVYGVGSKLPASIRPQTKTSIDATCREAFDTLLSNMEECLGYVKSDPTSALKYYLPSLTFSDCQDALEEFGLSVPEVQNFNRELTGMTSNLMTVVGKNSAYA